MQLFDWTPEGGKKRMANALKESPREFTCPIRQTRQAYEDELVEVALLAQEIFAEAGQPLDVVEAAVLAEQALRATETERREG